MDIKKENAYQVYLNKKKKYSIFLFTSILFGLLLPIVNYTIWEVPYQLIIVIAIIISLCFIVLSIIKLFQLNSQNLFLKSEMKGNLKNLNMTKEHKGLDLAGIIIVYIMSSIYLIAMIASWLNWSWLVPWEAFLLILSVVTLVLTILYHTNKITNYILIGILGILISVIGGIFILVDQPKTINNTKTVEEDDLSNLEYKLRQLDTLLTKGVLTKEEYNSKRKSIINNQ
ncbi:MAG: hypothetical protein K9L64_05960 [Candidatus Izimaplasma sp.]|nr:hypothetical protein [Candidatus Izimaplasma bacterium]